MRLWRWLFGDVSLTKRAVVMVGATGVIALLARQLLGQWALLVVMPVGAVLIATGLRTSQPEQPQPRTDQDVWDSEAQEPEAQ